MKYAIVGAGAIGGYLGARLALSGEQVTFIARNKNLAAINAQGFRLLMPDGSTQHASSVRAVQDPAQAGPQDVVLQHPNGRRERLPMSFPPVPVAEAASAPSDAASAPEPEEK